MENYHEEIVRLIRHSLTGELTENENRKLGEWRLESDENEKLYHRIRRDLRAYLEGELFCSLDEQKAWKAFLATIQRRKKLFLIRRIASYAALLALPLLVVGVYFSLNEGRLTDTPDQSVVQIIPGETRAVLVSAGGVMYELKQEQNSQEFEVEQGVFVKQEGGNLVYDSLARQSNGKALNTLKVPRGGEFKLILSDGTIVYLNAATELRYPVAFGNSERKVYLSGEAYFQVASKKNQAFIVVTDELQVSVYGTEFNVNTHRKEGVQTVLVQGKVGIKIPEMEEIELRPGELAHWDKNEKKLAVKSVNVRPYVAWKEGRFAFENERLEEIMHRLALWYNVEVNFASEEVKELLFTGYMKRYDEITDILHAMTDVVGVKFKVVEKNITVYK